MARTAKLTKTKTTSSTEKLASKTIKQTRGQASGRKGLKKPEAAMPPKRAKSTIVAKAPKLSVADLRAQLEKLERANTTLRTRSREAVRAAKTANAHIAELEGKVTVLEKRLAKTVVPAKPRPSPKNRAKRIVHEITAEDSPRPSPAVEGPAQIEDEDAIEGEN